MKKKLLKQRLIPAYVSNFSCIGKDCESSCCSNWTITFDKASVRRYKKSKDPIVAKIAATSIKPYRVGNSVDSFAKVKLDKTGHCAFLDQVGLCEIHKRLGEEALSTTCKTFPRQDVALNGQKRDSLSMGCPEAARKILLDPSAFWVDCEELPEPIETYEPAPVISSLNAAVMQLVMLEKASMEERLYAIGLLLMQSERLVSQFSDENELSANIEALLVQTVDSYNTGVLSQAVNDLTFYAPPQIGVLMQLTEQLGVSKNRSSDRWLESVQSFLNLSDSLKEQPEALLYQLTLGWEKAKVFFDENPQIWVNYFLYNVYDKNFPYHPSMSYLEVFRILVVDFFLLRSYFSAMALKGVLDEQNVIKLFQSQATQRQHNASFVVRVNALLDQMSLTGCYSMVLLCQASDAVVSGDVYEEKVVS